MEYMVFIIRAVLNILLSAVSHITEKSSWSAGRYPASYICFSCVEGMVDAVESKDFKRCLTRLETKTERDRQRQKQTKKETETLFLLLSLLLLLFYFIYFIYYYYYYYYYYHYY